MSAFKRLKVDEDSKPLSWRNPRFADWKLSWQSGSSEAKSWDVHRAVLVAGARPAHFFAGATREGGYDSHATDLSVLLPEACKDHVERALDFIYGQPLGECAAQDVMPLFKIADALQCPSLQNSLVDLIEKKSDNEYGAVELLLKDACAMELYNIAESLVCILPLEKLKALDFDLIDVNNLCLMRAVARRLAEDTRGAFFWGHGRVRDRSISLDLPNIPVEKRMKGYWCFAASNEEVFAGSHTWKLRIDHAPSDTPDSNMNFGIVSGDPPAPHETLDSNIMMHSYFSNTACLDVGTPEDWTVHVAAGGEAQPAAIAAPRHTQRARAGDIMYVSVKLFDGKSNGDIEWRLNESVVGSSRGTLKPASYRLSVKLAKHDTVADTMGMTLLAYTKE